MAEWAPMHLVGAGDDAVAHAFGFGRPDPRADGIAGMLPAIRQLGGAAGDNAAVRLVLPAPGDVADLPANTDFARAAAGALQGVLIGAPGTDGIGLVPVVEGPDVLRWTVYGTPIPEYGQRDQGLGAAEYAMREAVRGAADALGTMQALPTRTLEVDPRTHIAQLIADAGRHRYPADVSERAFRVLESADRVAAILSVAMRSAPTESPTAAAAAAREDLIRPLWSAVRTARLTAVATSIESAMHSA